MDGLYNKKQNFFKILIWQNPNCVIGNFHATINILQKSDYDTYVAYEDKEVEFLLKNYIFSLIIIDGIFLTEETKCILKDLPLIIIFLSKDLNRVNKVIHNCIVVDYFFMPIDTNLLLQKVNFFLQKNKEVTHVLKHNLYNYLWESKLYQEEKLHNSVWKNDYNHYSLTKSSQFIMFFSTVICLMEDVFSNMSFMVLLKKITNIISLQMCFFNCYISFTISNHQFPTNYNINCKNFLLFLVFIGELCKNSNINCEVTLSFEKIEDSYMVVLEIPTHINKLIMTYNNMYLDTNTLFHFLQQYLWQHWKKNIYSHAKSDRISVIEIFLKNKK
jgi:hypothetical protein